MYPALALLPIPTDVFTLHPEVAQGLCSFHPCAKAGKWLIIFLLEATELDPIGFMVLILHSNYLVPLPLRYEDKPF